MPIYEYSCSDCGKKFEIIRMISDADAPILCECCKSDHTRRVISVFNAQSGSKIIAGNNNGGCSGCSSSSCSSCNIN